MDGWIVGSLDEDDGIGVGIENPRTEMIEGAVEMESGMAGGEAGHEDVEIGRIGFAVMLHLVVDFDPFFGDGADPAHVVSATVQKSGGSINSLTCVLLVCCPNLPLMEFSMSLARAR